MVREELPGGHSPPAVGMGGFHVPALGAIREQEGEVERHGTGVEVRHTLETSSPDLDHQVHVFHKNKKSAKIFNFCGRAIKYQIGSNLRPICSQNFIALAERTTEIQNILWIALKMETFHKTKKICQNKHFWWLGHKRWNWLRIQTYLQPKFQISSSKITEVIKILRQGVILLISPRKSGKK